MREILYQADLLDIIFLILRFLAFATDVVLLDFLDVRSCYAICSLVLSL